MSLVDKMPRRLIAGTWLVVLSVSVVSCSRVPDARAPDEREPTTLATAGVGWVEEYARSSEGASTFERAILADGAITSAELNQSRTHMRRCISDAGFTIEWDQDGGFEMSARNGDQLTAAVDAQLERARTACSSRYDKNISYLFTETRRNPARLDEAEMAVSCLRRAGLVDDSYTERRWRAEYDEGRFSFDEWSVAGTQCRLDPLGLWRKQ